MKKVVVIGGGTGSFTVLSGLKYFDLDLSCIVSMADDGGSTGILRDELGVLPPGDVRQCMIALSDSSRLMRDLMGYRFDNGGLKGHSFGNLLLSALEKVTGSFEKAVEEMGKIINMKGKVIPVTTNKVRLKMILNNGKLLDGERRICESSEVCEGFRSLFLEPSPRVNPHAIDEIINADLVVFGPGGFYTSLIPNLLVEGISEALKKTRAQKVFVINLVNKNSHTPKFKAGNYLKEIEKVVGENVWDFFVINNGKPSKELVKFYSSEGNLIENDLVGENIIEADIISDKIKEVRAGDLLKRNLIRHDSDKLAKVLFSILDKK